MASNVPSSSNADSLRQRIKSAITNNLSTYFGATLNKENDVVNVVMALVYKESSFNPNATFPGVLPITGGVAKDYYNSSVIQNLLKTGTPEQKANEVLGRRALGLGQVLGLNIIRGASSSGKCLVEQYRPDLVGQLVIDPGADPRTKLLGEANIDTAILAALVTLESKWKIGGPSGTGWAVKVRRGGSTVELVFGSRLQSAVGGYLGYGSAGDANGTTASSYVADIVGGNAYKIANGGAAPATSGSAPQASTAVASGPATTPAQTGGASATPGCVAVKS